MINKPNFIIVGPDMCGKTQIAKHLSKRFDIPYFKPSDEKLTFLKNQSKFLNDARYADPRMVDFLSQTGHRAIFDRGYPCEWVYSQYFSRETDYDALRYVDDAHRLMGSKIIITHRSSYDGIEDDLDSKLKGEVLKKIEDLYFKFSEWTKCNVIFLNVDSGDLEEETNQVIRQLEKK